jgi:murein DD-endopeptidase MepM/ murein hydrolase activator NlpD
MTSIDIPQNGGFVNDIFAWRGPAEKYLKNLFIFSKAGNTSLRRCLNMSKRNTGSSISGKGYYIALILCAVAIGITGYLYYSNANDPSASLRQNEETYVDVNAGDVEGNDVEAVATNPQGSDVTTPQEQTKPVENKKLQTAAPLAGETLSQYAMDSLSYNQTTRDWRTHNGVDIAAEAGAQVAAAAAGTVYSVYNDDTMGMTVVINHEGGYTTKYASLAEEVSVAPGDAVELGQTIGCVGNSALLESALGDHLHFAVTCNGESMDPAVFLQAE